MSVILVPCSEFRPCMKCSTMQHHALLFACLAAFILGLGAVPTDITLTGGTYTPPSSYNLVVGTLTVTDTNPTYHILRIVGGEDAALFNLNDFELRITNQNVGKSVLQVTIRALDWEMFYVERSFNITANNVAPTDIHLVPSTYSPPSAVDLVVGTLTTTDANTDQGHSYAITGGDNATVFKIVGAQVAFAVAEVEATGLLVQITATDPFGSMVAKLLTVNYVNVAPTMINISSYTYTPPSTANLVVGTLLVQDANYADTFTYSITGGAHGDVFNIAGDQLRITSAGEQRTNLMVNITVTDSGGLQFDRLFHIMTTNVVPSDITASPALYDPSNPTAYAANLTVTDANPEQVHTFTIIGGKDQANFAIVNSKLTITNSGLRDTGLIVEVRADDGKGGVYAENLTINYENIPPYDVFISNNMYTPPSTVGMVVGTVSGLDWNNGQDLTFSLPAGEEVFELVNDTNMTNPTLLVFKKAGERRTLVEANITVNDGALSFMKTLYINYTNVAPSDIYWMTGGNYTPPTTVGVVVGTIGVVDTNLGQTHTLSLATNPYFTLNGTEIRAAVAGLNLPEYSLVITATDEEGATVTKTLTLTYVNVGPYDITLFEDNYWTPPSTANMAIATIRTLDWNSADNFTYTIIPGEDADVFNIHNDQLRITNASEGRNYLYVTIQTTDPHGETFQKRFLIQTSQVAPHQLIFTGSLVFYPPSPINFTVGFLSGADYNLGDTLVYQIVGGADANKFYLEGNRLFMVTGQTSNSLSVEVAVLDPRRRKTQTLTFTALNMPPTGATLSASHYTLPVSTEQYVGYLTAIDSNANDTHTFKIVPGYSSYAFEIKDGNRLWVKAGTTGNVLTVVVEVMDQHGASGTETLMVTAAACPAGYTLGTHNTCYKYVSNTDTYANQQTACVTEGYSSPDIIGQSGIASLTSLEDRTLLVSLNAVNPVWVADCYLVTAPSGQCVYFTPNVGTNWCTVAACTGSYGTICTVPVGSALPEPLQVLNVGSLSTATAYSPGSPGTLVTFADGPASGYSKYSFLYKALDVEYFTVQAYLQQLDSGATSGLVIKSGNDYFQFMVSGLKTYMAEAVIGGNTVVSLASSAISELPSRVQCSKGGETISCSLYFPTSSTISRIFTGLNFTAPGAVPSYSVGIGTVSSTATIVKAIYSSVVYSQGAIKIRQFLPAQGAVNVDHNMTTKIVVFFDRDVVPGTGSMTYNTGINSSVVSVPVSSVQVAGTNMTWFMPPSQSLMEGATYFFDIPAGFVRDPLSRDAFEGTPQTYIFSTAPTAESGISSTENITMALDSTMDKWDFNAFCAAFQMLYPSMLCSQLDVLSLSSGSVVVVFRITNLATAAVTSVTLSLAQAFEDNSLSDALQAVGQGAILTGSYTIGAPSAEEMPSMYVSLNPSAQAAPTKVTFVARTTNAGLPKNGYVELLLPKGFKIGAVGDIVIKMEASFTSEVQYLNATTVNLNYIGFSTVFEEINHGRDAIFTIESGVTMPDVCWGLNNWIWGARFYDKPGGNLHNYILNNPPNDQCNGYTALKVNTPPRIHFDPAPQYCLEDDMLQVTKPIQIEDDAELASDARYTVELILDQPGSSIHLWAPQFVYQQVQILNGTDNSSYIRFSGSPFQTQYALANLIYYPAPDFWGVENLTVVVYDNGYCCDMVPMESRLFIPIYVVPVNDAPIMITPGNLTQTIFEDRNTTFTCTVLDVDAGAGDLEVTISVTKGTMVLYNNWSDHNVSLVAGNPANSDSFMRLRGTIEALNTVMSNVMFIPLPDETSFSGPAEIRCQASDLGNGPQSRDLAGLTAQGITYGASTAQSSNILPIDITIVGINDEPAVYIESLSGFIPNITMDEDGTQVFKVRIDDVDPSFSSRALGPGLVTLVMTVQHGKITSGLSMTEAVLGADNYTGINVTVYTINATVPAINAATFQYMPSANWYGQALLKVEVHDSKYDGGVGTSLSASANLTVYVQSVNDHPVLILHHAMDSAGVVEFHRDTLQALPVGLADVDVYNGTLDLYVNATHGFVFLQWVEGLESVTGNVSGGEHFLHVKGKVQVLQQALLGLMYLDKAPRRDPVYHIVDPLHNTDQIYIHITDQGATGSGGFRDTTLLIPLRITATLWNTCQEFVSAHSGYCGCYYKTSHSGADSNAWTKLPMTFPSQSFLASTYPRRFMQGCCADMIKSRRDLQLTRVGELGVCTETYTL